MAHGKLREIERLRGVAVLAVVLYHLSPLWPKLPDLAKNGWSGVDLFFVISGFVVTLSLERLLPDLSDAPDVVAAFQTAWTSVRRFWVRRLYRLGPMLVFLVLLNVGLTYASRGSTAFNSFKEEEREAVVIFAGVINYAHDSAKFLGHLWSLAVEEHFYLLLPIVFVLARTRAHRVVACGALLLLVALVIRPMGDHAGKLFFERTASHLRFDELFAGVLLALLRSRTNAPVTLPKWFAVVFVVPGCMALLFMLPAVISLADGFNWGSIAFWLFSLILVAYAARDEGYVLPVPGLSHALEFVGARSYGLYLVHQPLYRAWCWLEGTHTLHPALAPLHNAKAVFIILAASLLVCDLAHRCIEQPFIALGRAQTRPDGAPEPAPAPLPVFAARVGGVVALFLGLVLAGSQPWRPQDWRVEHYSNQALWSRPDRVTTARFLPLPGLERDFSMRARTCLVLDHETDVTFTLQSDDGSRLFMDGEKLIDLWGPTKTPDTVSKKFPKGRHALKVEYFQGEGDEYLRLSVAFDGGPARDIGEAAIAAGCD